MAGGRRAARGGRTPFVAGSLRGGTSKVLQTGNFPPNPPEGPWQVAALIRISEEEGAGAERAPELSPSEPPPPA